MKNTEEPQIAIVLMETNTIKAIMRLLATIAPDHPEVFPLIEDIFNHQPEPYQMFNRHVFTDEQYAALTESSLN